MEKKVFSYRSGEAFVRIAALFILSIVLLGLPSYRMFLGGPVLYGDRFYELSDSLGVLIPCLLAGFLALAVDVYWLLRAVRAEIVIDGETVSSFSWRRQMVFQDSIQNLREVSLVEWESSRSLVAKFGEKSLVIPSDVQRFSDLRQELERLKGPGSD